MSELPAVLGQIQSGGGVVSMTDGRRLAYAEFGDPQGVPVFHFHGHPGSRFEASILHEPAVAARVRLIGVDRPGMGKSDFATERLLTDWPDDLADLADSLSLDRFAVQGISGGGPYALAVANAMPERLTSINVISSAGPTGLGTDAEELSINRLQRRLVRYAPFVLDVAFALMTRSVRAKADSVGFTALGTEALRGLPEVDRQALAPSPLAARYGLALREAFRQGGRGAAHDARLLSRPWGFDVSRIHHPNLHVWHGGLDRNVSFATGQRVAEAIPGSHAHFHANEGHISVAINHAEELLGLMSQVLP